jgi:hypothetical protein
MFLVMDGIVPLYVFNFRDGIEAFVVFESIIDTTCILRKTVLDIGTIITLLDISKLRKKEKQSVRQIQQQAS